MKQVLIFFFCLTLNPALAGQKKKEEIKLLDEYWKLGNPNGINLLSGEEIKRLETIMRQVNLTDDIKEEKKCKTKKDFPFDRNNEILAREILGIYFPILSTKELYFNSNHIACFKCHLSNECSQMQSNWEQSYSNSNFVVDYLKQKRIETCWYQVDSYRGVKKFGDVNQFKYDFAHCKDLSFDICPSFSHSSNSNVHLHKSCFSEVENKMEMKLIERKFARIFSLATYALSDCEELPVSLRRWKRNPFSKSNLFTCMGESNKPYDDKDRVGVFHFSKNSLNGFFPFRYKKKIRTVIEGNFFWQPDEIQISYEYTEDSNLAEKENYEIDNLKPHWIDDRENQIVEYFAEAMLNQIQRVNNSGEYDSNLSKIWSKSCVQKKTTDE